MRSKLSIIFSLVILSTLSMWVCATPESVKNVSDLGLEKIMSDPDWLGNSPKSPRWSRDGSAVYYQQKAVGHRHNNQMKVDLIQLIKAVHVNAKKSTFMTLPGTYELFGVDWAVDQRGKGWVLEINPEPSMLLYPQLKRGREEMLGGDFLDKKNGDGLPSGWEKIWSSQTMDAMKRLRRKRLHVQRRGEA